MALSKPRVMVSTAEIEMAAARASELQDLLDVTRRLFSWGSTQEIAAALQTMASEHDFQLDETRLSLFSTEMGAGRRVNILA